MGTLIKLDPLDYFGESTVDLYISNSRKLLEDAGFDVEAFLMQSPFGSDLRKHVTRTLSMDFDTIQGLASIVLEKALHIKYFLTIDCQKTKLASFAYELGVYGTRLEVYRLHTGTKKENAEKPRPKHPVPAALKDAFKNQRRQGRTLQEALTAMGGDNDNLRVKDCQNSPEYLVTLEGPNGELHEKTYKLKGLENLFTASKN